MRKLFLLGVLAAVGVVGWGLWSRAADVVEEVTPSQIAILPIATIEARAAIRWAGGEPPEEIVSDPRIAYGSIRTLVSQMESEVTDEDIALFYNDNRQIFGTRTIEHSSYDIKRILAHRRARIQLEDNGLAMLLPEPTESTAATDEGG